jgi:hypothetical protein
MTQLKFKAVKKLGVYPVFRELKMAFIEQGGKTARVETLVTVFL